MKKGYKKIYNILLIFIIVSPFLDNLTYLLRNVLNFDISLSTILKPLFMGVYFLILMFILKKNNEKVLKYFIPIFIFMIYCILHFVLIKGLYTSKSGGSIYDEINKLIQLAYLLITLINFYIIIFKNNIFKYDKDKILKYLVFSGAIYYIFYLISIVTGTSALTYANNVNNIGYRGWLNPSHLINHYAVLLFPVCWLLYKKYNKNYFLAIFLLVGISCYYFIGTKSGTFGIIMDLCCISILEIINFFSLLKTKKSLSFLIPTSLFVISLLAFNLTPCSNNLNNTKQINKDFEGKTSLRLEDEIQYMESINNEDKDESTEGSVSENIGNKSKYYSKSLEALYHVKKSNLNNLVSGSDNRRNQLSYSCKLFELLDIRYKALGIGFYNQPRNLAMEDDFFSILFNYGIVCFIIIVLPLLLIYLYCLKKIAWKVFKLRVKDIYYEIMLFISMSLCMSLMITTGYLLSQPSLIILYVPIFYICLYSLKLKSDGIYIMPRLKKYASKIIRTRYKRNYNLEINNRKNLSIFEYKKLSEDLCESYKELSKDNNLYGIAKVLREYSDYKGMLDLYIEHGANFTTSVYPESAVNGLDKILTLSNHRKEIIEEKNKKKAIPIGPYIYYAKPLFDEKYFKKEKKKLGKVLLVFTSKSIPGVNHEFDHEMYIKEINRIRKKYAIDTVLVNIYYFDIQNGMAEIYEKAGFKVVTAGHKYDENFTKRLKYIISLSDYTMSNNIGTHIGYCLSMDKPHYVYEQVVEIKGESFNQEFYEERYLSYIKSDKEIRKEFNKFSNKITEAQLEIYEKYWGKSSLKSKSELYEILKDDIDG
ncbi:MAG: O-antigen ligase family protein [Clostridium sp.]|nr:O-antigen ligase family protein [Clostridium sp.]MCM1444671.1 O-antigen ligase family protein [Candidatus Amulumruptor caecigallinarius]